MPTDSTAICGMERCIDGYLASQRGVDDVYSFVMTTWGAISTIDLDSESYRWIGALRFTLKGVSEIFWKNHYFARIYWKAAGRGRGRRSGGGDGQREPNDDEFWWKELPDLKLDGDGDGDGGDSGKAVRRWPSGWRSVEGEFGVLCVTNLQWIAEDSMMGGQDFNGWSNTLRLVWSEKTGRVGYAQILLGLETGTHLEADDVHYVDVEEVVIEPLRKGPPIDVDGERKPLKPVRVKLLKSDLVVSC